MSNIDSIEIDADSIEEATREALAQLGAREDEVAIEVLATPRAGVLGLGARNARVRVTRKPASASSPRDSAAGANPDATGAAVRKSVGQDEQRAEAIVILKQILEQMGERAEVNQIEVDAESVELEIKGDGSGILIGRHGQTLDALEYIVNRILARRIKDAAPISLETESYRSRRRQQLHRMALSVGERAKREHGAVRLDPMPPRDRRVVHLALKDDPMITTRSVGDGFMRSIEIVPVDGGGRRESPGAAGQSRSRSQPQSQSQGPAKGANEGRGRRRERENPPERKDEAIGEQGGFKHGQKRIV
jgi:spoIIIJ-associated protein